MWSNKYERAMELSDSQFKMLVGVNKETVILMIEILREAYNRKHKCRGRPSKLSIEMMMLMTLEYWRRYVTYFEQGFEYVVSESPAHDIVVCVEDTLIKSGKFSLPGKKVMLKEEEIEVVLVDVTESPVERPKKTRSHGIRGKRKGIR